MFDKILDAESYWGEVISTDDPTKASKVKVKIKTIYDELPDEHIPWALPRYLDGHSHDLPAVGDIVQIKFINNDIYYPTWYRIRKQSENLSNEDYQSASVLIEKNLDKYNLDGELSVRYTQSEGLLLELTRDGNTSQVIIRNDNTILLKNGNTEKIIHISNESISIGSETKSQQPAVVGNDNHKAFDMVNDTIKSLSKLMDKHLDQLSKIAKSNPYTSLLSPPLKIYKQEVKMEIDKLHKNNADFFPETKSQIATIDKE
jgi:hypothetical protein